MRYIDPNGNFVFLAPLAWYAGSVAFDVITDMLMNPQADLKYCLMGSMFSNAIPGGGIVNKAKKIQKVYKHSSQALRKVKVSENTRKAVSKKNRLIKNTSNQKLKNAINQMYRPGAKIGDGSLANALKVEIKYGELAGGKSHIKKGLERIRNLEKIMGSGQLNEKDWKTANNLVIELKKALNGK